MIWDGKKTEPEPLRFTPASEVKQGMPGSKDRWRITKKWQRKRRIAELKA